MEELQLKSQTSDVETKPRDSATQANRSWGAETWRQLPWTDESKFKDPPVAEGHLLVTEGMQNKNECFQGSQRSTSSWKSWISFSGLTSLSAQWAFGILDQFPCWATLNCETQVLCTLKTNVSELYDPSFLLKWTSPFSSPTKL